MDNRPDRRNSVAFSNSFVVVGPVPVVKNPRYSKVRFCYPLQCSFF